MRTKVSKALATFCAALFLGFTVQAQTEDDKILEGVQNPKMFETIDLATMDKELSTFTNLIMLSGLGVSMELADNHTLLVPTNEAFADMSIEQFAKLTDPKNKAQLLEFVKFHVIPKKVMAEDFEGEDIISTDVEQEIAVDYNNGIVTVGGARVIKADIEASNGVIHIVNGVIQPSTDVVPGR